jgi:hypothetical protein
MQNGQNTYLFIIMERDLSNRHVPGFLLKYDHYDGRLIREDATYLEIIGRGIDDREVIFLISCTEKISRRIYNIKDRMHLR